MMDLVPLETRLESALARIQELARPQTLDAREALLFNLERAAWAMIEMAQAWVYELRLGIPRKETECFDLLQRQGLLELEVARRFKQLCEFRSLSSRPPERIDAAYLEGDLALDVALFRDWIARSRRFTPA